MNARQIADYCHRYFTASECLILEKAPTHIKVKLSPEADRDLTGRSYYWNFVERTGAEPETMSFHFKFTVEPESPESPAKARVYTPIIAQSGRPLEETVVYGSRRLEQIFASAGAKGAYLQLFEEPPELPRGSAYPLAYTTWLGVNYKVEFICDMKKEELYSLGISMSTGEIVFGFDQRLRNLKLTAKLPKHAMLKESIALERAALQLEATIENELKHKDYRWASEALDRMQEELQLIAGYYDSMRGGSVNAANGQPVDDWDQEHARRKEEIEWQYRPRVEVTPVNCGWFHLRADTFRNR